MSCSYLVLQLIICSLFSLVYLISLKLNLNSYKRLKTSKSFTARELFTFQRIRRKRYGLPKAYCLSALKINTVREYIHVFKQHRKNLEKEFELANAVVFLSREQACNVFGSGSAW